MTTQLPAHGWWAYVLSTSENATPSEIARKIGVSQSSVWRWKESSPSVAGVRSFAQGYERPVLEAFVHAGFLRPEERWGETHLPPVEEMGLLSTRLMELSHLLTHRVPVDGDRPTYLSQVIDPPLTVDVQPNLTGDQS